MATSEHENLELPPRKSMEDSGAHDLESSDSDDHFSDAQSGLTPTSPTPKTRVERVDDEPSHGEVPGTGAYSMRQQDAAPDEIEVVPEGSASRPRSTTGSHPSTAGEQPIPTTVVEKIDPEAPSYGNVPGTLAHHMRAADAVPDLVLKAGSPSQSPVSRSRTNSTPGDLPIPVTKVEKVDSKPSYGEVPGTKAHAMRTEDAQPDIVEEVRDESESPTFASPRSPKVTSHSRRKSSLGGKKTPAAATEYDEEVGEDEGFGDDFDDFEEGEEDAEFGDFDEGFQESLAPVPQPSLPASPLFPILDFASLHTPSEIEAATEPYLNTLFPPDTIDTSILPPLKSSNSIFPTPRSASLWSQLVAAPPLQPPNWIRSRIRRLFLVSLGVPVDLDEILPASKQKKLILPSINLPQSRSSTDSRSRDISRLKQLENASSTSLDSQGQPTKPRSESKQRRKGPPPAPALDLVSARQFVAITDEALKGYTVDELKEYVKKLEAMQGTAREVLEYWTNQTDAKLGDREAFEGVIENLVKHARKVRK